MTRPKITSQISGQVTSQITGKITGKITGEQVAALRSAGLLPEPRITPPRRADEVTPGQYQTGAWRGMLDITVTFELGGRDYEGSFDPNRIGSDNQMIIRAVAKANGGEPPEATPTQEDLVNQTMAMLLTADWQEMPNHTRLILEAFLADQMGDA